MLKEYHLSHIIKDNKPSLWIRGNAIIAFPVTDDSTFFVSANSQRSHNAILMGDNTYRAISDDSNTPLEKDNAILFEVFYLTSAQKSSQYVLVKPSEEGFIFQLPDYEGALLFHVHVCRPVFGFNYILR